MSNVTELEQRISVAMDRIEKGLGDMAEQAPAVDGAALEAQLEDERSANAQLEERVKALKERQDTKISELEARVSFQRDQMAALDTELQRLRASSADMREVNAQLRIAATDGVAEPELINRAMMAEVEALSAQRASESAEVDAILKELKPLIEEA
ncbi:MAG: chromosome segregation ATPase [Yoonia sp.]|jgi:chromosome segregation ATPase